MTLVKSNKSISRKKNFDQNPFFAISKMAKNQILKSLKLTKMQFYEKKINLFDLTSFFAWIFLNFFPVQNLIFGHF